MRIFFNLCLLLQVCSYVKCDDKDEKVQTSTKRRCSNPWGELGDFFIKGCLRKTCRRKGKGARWIETYESGKCCNHDQQWFEMGDIISETHLPDNCTSSTLRCVDNQGVPELKFDTRNECNQKLSNMIIDHANTTSENVEKISRKINDLQTLLETFLNKSALFNQNSEGISTSSKTSTTFTKVSKVRSSTTTITTATTTKSTTTTAMPSQSNNDLLFIGPGQKSGGQSEVLLLPSLIPANCTPPKFPGGNLQNYVGTMTIDGPMLCGGYTVSSKLLSDCHLLAKFGTWFGTPALLGMNIAKGHMASIEIQDGWWVTGGYDEKMRRLISTDFWSNHTWKRSVNLPQAMSGHCLVRINSTHAFLTGGYPSASKTAYLFGEATGFVRQADMITGRYYHGCAMQGEKFVFVAGPSIKSEYFSLETMKWLAGPDLPSSNTGGKMVTIDGKATFFVGKKIYQLQEIGGLSFNWWKWIDVGEMKSERAHFDIIKMKQGDCDTWN